MTPAGIEPATFRFVAQHFNHCATAFPKSSFTAALFVQADGMIIRWLNANQRSSVSKTKTRSTSNVRSEVPTAIPPNEDKGLLQHFNVSFCIYLATFQRIVARTSSRSRSLHFWSFYQYSTTITSWSSGQGLWLLTMRSRVRFPVLPLKFFFAGKDSRGDHGLGS